MSKTPSCTPRLLGAPRRTLLDYTGAPTSATIGICVAGLVRAFGRSFPLLRQAAPSADIFVHAGIDVGERGWAAAAGAAQTELQQACSYEHTQRAVLEETPRCSTYTPEQRTAEQGRRVARCFELIERHAPTRYTLLMRTRTDLVYPPRPFPFDAIAREVGRHREWLAIPLCCDFKGLNDQLAVGTPGTMRLYARSPGWAAGRRSDVAIKQALAQVPGSRRPPVALRRFWYEYALLRADQLPLFDAVGSTVFAQFRHSAMLANDAGSIRMAWLRGVPSAFSRRQTPRSARPHISPAGALHRLLAH